MKNNIKSPFKYSAGLKQGAYEAAMVDTSGDLGKLGASKAISNVSQTIAGTGIALTQYFGEIGKQYDEFVDDVMKNGATLSDDNFEILYDELQSGRNNFILGSKRDKTLAIKDLTELAASYEDYSNLVENTAISADSEEGLIDVFKNSPEGSAYLDAVSGKSKLIKNPNPNADNKNQLGVMMNDEWISLNELKKIGDRNSKDTKFASTTEALALKQLQSKTPPDMNAINYGVSRMVKNGKTKSLIHSEIIPNRTFYGDVVTKLMSKKYVDLGLTPESINTYAEDGNINVEDGIDSDEAQFLANTMINDPGYKQQLDAELTEYYSNYIAQQNPLYKPAEQAPSVIDTFNEFADIPEEYRGKITELQAQFEAGDISKEELESTIKDLMSGVKKQKRKSIVKSAFDLTKYTIPVIGPTLYAWDVAKRLLTGGKK